MWRVLGKLAHEVGGAVAPTIALSLAALVAAGGIAFDYARLGSMDTELQDAADQAALAAATQLDGETGARARAISAARNLISNLTYFANDSGGTAVNIPETSITFYSDYDPATGAKTAANGDDDANYVQVTTGGRTAHYALTPVVAAFSSGQITASAFATLDSAWCNLPPFMMCAPTGGNFNPDDHIGAGLHMIIGSPNTPGNFGFLQTGFGAGAANLAKAIGWNGSAGGCVATRGMPTEPGDKTSVRAAVNTRFDMSEGGQQCPAGGTCSPSTNARKDLVHATTGSLNQRCSSSGNQGWGESAVPYRAPNTTPLSSGNKMTPSNTYPDMMGDPPDICHAVQPNTCGLVGDGVWDRNAYFQVNYGWNHATWTSQTGLQDSTPSAANYATRYRVYLWEAAHPLPTGAGNPGIGTQQGPFQIPNGSGGGKTNKFTDSQPVCRPPGVAPTNPDLDRRRTTVAVVDCGAGPNGRGEVQPLVWMDIFLVEPSFRRPSIYGLPARTQGDEVYAEIIGGRPLPGIGQTIGNIVRKDVPRLVE